VTANASRTPRTPSGRSSLPCSLASCRNCRNRFTIGGRRSPLWSINDRGYPTYAGVDSGASPLNHAATQLPWSNDARRAPKKDLADLAMREYLSLRTEIIFHISSYKSHTRYLTVSLTLIVGFLSLVLRNGLISILPHHPFVLFVLSLAITTVVAYLAFDVLESLYALLAVASRAASLEHKINELAEHFLLAWEEKLSPAFWSGQAGAWPPSVLVGVYVLIMMFLGVGVVPSYSVITFWNDSTLSAPWGPYLPAISWVRIVIVLEIAYIISALVVIVWYLIWINFRFRGRAERLVKTLTW
jgi:hypothetical protein